ncbi:MAG TPA: alcohol dehydrogenase catalytic domain-containing protein [Armatimonadota bacterium]|nr:alcohol dehydrogenase catalytic domain-containing protein [Armatimonadota bacterium]
MNAARYDGKQSILVEDRPGIEPGPDEVRLAVSLCGICGTDLHFYSGRWPQPEFTPGHEIAGAIDAVGPGVGGWLPGDRVCVDPSLSCGKCAFCHRGETNRCQDFQFISIHRAGGMASHLVVPTSCLHRIPDSMSDSLAALVEPLAVGVHAIRIASLAHDETVVICGLGAIGLACVAAAREAGAGPIIASGRYPHQREAAARLGAVPVAPEDLEAAVANATHGVGADIAFETVGGAGQAVGQAIGAVRAGGAVVLVGGFTRPASIHLWRVVSREIRLLGANCYSRDRSPTDFEKAMDLAEPGRFRLDELVTHRIPLAEVAKAFQLSSDKSSGAIKVQLECTAAG